MLSDENMERKTKGILYDYFADQDLEEAVVRVKELSTQQHHHFVLFAIYTVLERSASARKQTGQLLHDLIKQSVISVGSFFEGFADVLTLAEDLEIDNPKIWQFYGELMSPIIEDGTISLRSIKLAVKPLIARTKTVDVLYEITGGAIKREQNVDISAIQLGPGYARRFAGWGRGNTGGTTGRPSQKKEKPNTPTNSKSVDGRHRERSHGRAEQERQPSLAQPSSSELKLMTPDEMEKKTKAILDEYFAVRDMKEAILCVQEMSAQNHHQFVLYAINHVLERSSTARKQTGHVLHDLVKQKVISVDNYIKGLVEMLEFAKEFEIEIEIPKIWQYFGEMISPMILDSTVPLSFLKQAAQPLIANNKAGVLLAEILHDASHREGHKKVAILWRFSGMHWSDFVPENQVEQFLRDKALEFTNCAPTTPTTGLPLKDIETKLNDLIVQKKADNEKVFDWIEGNYDEQTAEQPNFIRALMTAVCTSAIKGEKGKERLEHKEISNRNDLLQKYLDHQADTELQALYALQALITKLEHPQGILRGMFDTLYDEDIISKDAFFLWEMSEEEPEGKSSCLKQAVQFFTWLREAEDDS